MTTALHLGDCLEVLRELPDASVDAVVTDPPYGLEFMGKEWDAPWKDERTDKRGIVDPRIWGGTQDGNGGNAFSRSRVRTAAAHYGGDSAKVGRSFQAWSEAWAAECLRVLRPGGHLLSFGGTRTYHRLAAGIEDAGFEVRDCLAWMFGSGFPKSLDVSKAIDARAGAEREVVGRRHDAEKRTSGGKHEGWQRPWQDDPEAVARHLSITAPATDDARTWQGWGTALKPAFEPIVLARKPLVGTVAGNVLAHGTGALNIDACRIGMSDADREAARVPEPSLGSDTGLVYGFQTGEGRTGKVFEPPEGGRWPANVVLDEDAARMLDEQTGESVSTGGQASLGAFRNGDIYGRGRDERESRDPGYGDRGGASRFFYCAKVSRAERNAGLDGFEEIVGKRTQAGGDDTRGRPTPINRNVHPTVKPIDLMRWLIRLVTPPDGTILDPFLGSGSTGCAAALEGRAFIGIEREPDYMRIAEARIRFWEQHGEHGLEIVRARDAAERVREEVAASGQTDIFAALGEDVA